MALLAGASLVASLLAVPLAAPVSAQDYVVIPQAEFEDCWDHMTLGERYAQTDANGNLLTYQGTNTVLVQQCRLNWDNIDGYLRDKLPAMPADALELSEAIEIVKDYFGEQCRLSVGADIEPPLCRVGSIEFIHLDYRDSERDLADILEDDYEVLRDADVLRAAWWAITVDHQERRSPSSAYVYKPPYAPPARDDSRVTPTSPSVAPPTPTNAEWQNGGLKDGSTTSDDQYTQGDDGYHRRKKQPDGTFRCYFNGYDGSLANLGPC